MAKVYGEAIQDPQSKKWGYIMGHENDGIILERTIFLTRNKRLSAI